MVRGFEFRNVSFRYPGSSRLVLDRLYFQLKPGERVALVGENGQGKTTIVKLITRLYDPLEGQVLLDGVDLREYSLEDLYREIGVIFQDFMRYEMTARENIAVGQIDALASLEDLQLAAKKSMAAAVIHRLPLNYEQMLGRRFEGGVDLSGGEWQKVALARAYLRNAQLRAVSLRCSGASQNLRSGKLHCLFHIGFRPYAWQIALLYLRTARFRKTEVTRNWRVSAGDTPRCSKCKPPIIADSESLHATEYTSRDR